MSFHLFTKILEKEITYFGAELRPHWVAEQTKNFGSALVAFRGGADVRTDALVDIEDREANTFIKAKSMVHFLGEFFEGDLNWAVAQQRLLTVIIQEALVDAKLGGTFRRDGDDLYWRQSDDSKWRKLSVSIVTGSPVSSLLHFGINLDPAGAPVDAVGLDEIGIEDWAEFAAAVLQRFSAELASQWKARTKVIPR